MVKVAAVQLTVGSENARVIKKADQYMQAAAAKGAKIVCFSELFAWPWFPAEKSDDPFKSAEELGGPVTGKLAELAAKHGVATVCPFFERGEEGRFYNSAAIFDAKGESKGVYRKVHVPALPNWEEQHYFSPGDGGFPVFEVEGVPIGVQICWDNFFPEGFRSLGLGGAHIVFLPTAAAFASQERWLAMAISHAVANGVYVVRVNRAGSESGLDFYGGSFCVRPDGELVAAPMEMNEGVLLMDYDPELVAQTRAAWPFAKDRRPEEYGALVAPNS